MDTEIVFRTEFAAVTVQSCFPSISCTAGSIRLASPPLMGTFRAKIAADQDTGEPTSAEYDRERGFCQRKIRVYESKSQKRIAARLPRSDAPLPRDLLVPAGQAEPVIDRFPIGADLHRIGNSPTPSAGRLARLTIMLRTVSHLSNLKPFRQ